MRTILCTTDLSSGADEALRQADALARLHGAKLETLLVLPSPLRGDPLFKELNEREVSGLPRIVERVTALLGERVAAITGREPGEISTTVREGVPYAVIVDRAAKVDADLVVVGSTGATVVPRHRLGEVAEKVLRHAPCAVLVARPNQNHKGILAASDLSDLSLPAITVAAELSRLRGEPLTVVHNFDFSPAGIDWGTSMAFVPIISQDDLADAVKSSHAALQSVLARLRVTADAVVTRGAPAASILTLCEELQVSTVVVGTRGRTGLARVLLGSVAEAVARHAPCSVLAARPREGSDQAHA